LLFAPFSSRYREKPKNKTQVTDSFPLVAI